MVKIKLIIGMFLVCNCIVFSYTNVDLEQVKKYIPQDPIILEAGAHRGEDTVKMSTCWPLGTIYAFEPLPVSYVRLVKKVQMSTNVICFPFALSDKTGYADFYFDSLAAGDNGASSLYKPSAMMQHSYASDPLKVPCINLDEWADLYGISRIDFLWLDMEGAELATLKASPKILETVRAIHIEVNFIQLWNDIPLCQEVQQWLEERDFKNVWQSVNMSQNGNILFVKGADKSIR